MKLNETRYVVVLPDGSLMSHYRTASPRFFKTKAAAESRGEDYVHFNLPHDHETVHGWNVVKVKVTRSGD
jgi:hypothetical protein